MGYTFAEVTLKNVYDVGQVVLGDIKESEVRQKDVKALVDTGSNYLVITEELRRELGLRITGKRGVSLADNTRRTCDVAGPVEIHWKDRYATQSVLVVPDSPNVLLGAWPLEEMDLIVDPVRQEVTGAHGDDWVCYM
ncbi:MAG: aspartyl protease family protein [Treponema sp.]|jgi:clan AA aspartic protease|nr:aspartyl protease family protein [Treponema sp.]